MARGAPVVEGFGVIWPEADGFMVVCEGAIQIAFGLACDAPIVEGDGKVGLEADGLGVVRERAVRVPFFVARNAPVVEGFGLVRLEPDGIFRFLPLPMATPTQSQNFQTLHVFFPSSRIGSVSENQAV